MRAFMDIRLCYTPRMARQLIGAVLAALAVAAPTGLDSAFKAFWAAESPRQAAQAADAIAKTRVSFDEAYRRLQQGRAYTAGRTGLVPMSNRSAAGVEHHFVLNVPAAYDPGRKYAVR